MDFHIAVVGGGPGGSACAALLARKGLAVLLVERSSAPAEKVCGEFVCPQSFHILDAMGATPALAREPHRKVTGMVLSSPAGHRVDAPFPAAGGGCGPPRHGVSLPRPRFDGILQETAALQGAALWRGTRLSALEIGPGGATLTLRREKERASLRVRAQLVIGADGRFSAVARQSRLSLPPAGRARAAVHGYFEGVRGLGDKGEMHILPGGAYCALNPMPDGTCNVSCVDDLEAALRWRRREAGLLRDRLRQSALLREMFSRAAPAGPLRVLAPLQARTRRPYAERVMLVGDAAGFYDPLTGEGIYAALQTASMAAIVAERALSQGNCSEESLSEYGRMRAHWIRPKMLVWRLLQQLIRRERLVARFGAQLVRAPELAQLLVGLTGDLVSPLALLRPSILAKVARGLLPGSSRHLLAPGRGMAP
ncbi:MAG: hypothetical protein A3J27_14110 [Candidatus Tectomicrobia bacterium RIFCSPLOWO2_12_FULL_69_37]|nr:MAG: hypothetical protein A3I72_14520 [Candidatus Tectomicrobia bacterium RIFCSPLOWO2_02_FULL_70_19]OGL68914.1 MAG: hypothetical protein A3J27_14110 [Candidatus Tectomicrobia bacterium RIFCSPLOWO2_12_FULL_69_37]